jgi:SAM-dependent methyltransferase
MAHQEQLQFYSIVRDSFPDAFLGRKVLEVGSWDKNGSPRLLFEQCQYTGVDVAEGKGVDLLCGGQDLEFPSEFFDTVISGECFEHNRYWLETLVNMVRMLQPGGLCIFTCAGLGRQEHGTRRMMLDSSLTSKTGLDEYYHNLSARDVSKRIDLSAHFEAWTFSRNLNHLDLYFAGVKRGSNRPGLCEVMKAIERKAKQIDSCPDLPRRVLLRAYLTSRLRFLSASLLGDARFHNFEYSVRRLFQRF